jgi:hypothetical protein
MEKVREAIEQLDPREANLVSDRCVELLLQDGRKVRVTAEQDLKGEGKFWAKHEVAVLMKHGDHETVTAWGSIDLPWADGATIEACLSHAILLMVP